MHFTWDQVAFAFFPVFHIQRLPSSAAESCWIGSVTMSVSLPDDQRTLRRISSRWLCRFPSRFRFPGRIDRRRQRVNKRMHTEVFMSSFSYQVAVGKMMSERDRCSTDGSPASPPDPACLPTVVLPFHFFRLHAALLPQVLPWIPCSVPSRYLSINS